MGAVLAYTWRERGPIQASKLGAACRSIGLPLLLAVDAYRLLLGDAIVTVALRDTALAFIGVWLVQAAASGLGGTAGQVLSCRPMVYLGTISYGIYVWHGLVPIVLQHTEGLGWLASPGPAKFLFVAACSVGLASITWHLFEKRLNELKRYFPHSRPVPVRSRVAVSVTLAPDFSKRARALTL